MKKIEQKNSNESLRSSNLINMFMCGDVMAGRGIDQILPHPGDPLIHEPYMRSAKGYVEIAEKANGPIQQPVSFSYIWGDALEGLERVAPNLCAPGKGSIASAVARITGKAASVRA